MDNRNLGFGLMRLPSLDPNDAGKIDLNLTEAMVDAYLERGFHYFDTAWMYCNFQSENAVKEVLVKRHPRDSFTLTTKLHAGFLEKKEDRDKIFNAQLEKTGAGYFDYYWLHDINAHSIEVFEKLDCFQWLKDKKKEGLIRHIGFSFHDNAELLDEVLNRRPEMEYVQLQINYLDWESNAIQSHKCYDVAVKHNMPIIVMEPVKGGTLAAVPEQVEKLFKDYNPEASVSSWAIRYAASLPNIFMVLSGMSNLEQVLDNTSYMADFKPLTGEEHEIIKKAVDMINGTIAIPCTGCEYCMAGCPRKIPIPKCFSLYNADKQEVESKGWTPQGEYYDNMIKSTGKASDCIECRQCENVCPQHLPIVNHLKEVAGYFGK